MSFICFLFGHDEALDSEWRGASCKRCGSLYDHQYEVPMTLNMGSGIRHKLWITRMRIKEEIVDRFWDWMNPERNIPF